VENAQYPYRVKEYRRVDGKRYYTVHLGYKLVGIFCSKNIVEEYIKLNEKYTNGNGLSS
jgi:hypothetical protein